MAVAVEEAVPAVERELTNHQRNLVDTCFEEGNYDSAISLLDKLRHPSSKPHPSHIRNAVYIALCPPSSLEDRDGAAPRLESIPSSPSKFSRQQKGSLAPSPAATVAAQRLLHAYARTNSPGSLFRALPSYPVSQPSATTETTSAIDEDGDSEISWYSRRIRDAKSCWEILKEGFVKRDGSARAAAVSTRRGLRHNAALSDDEDSSSDLPAPVGQQAWPVLEWIVAILEKDEAATASTGQPRYSPLLLSQLPSSRSASGARWDVETPLDIVSFCLQQPAKAILGSRLLSLLINLTATTLVDLSMVLNAVYNRCITMQAETIQTLFLLLPPSQTCSRFKVSLCRVCLSNASDNSRKSRPKPQAKAVPRPLPARQRKALQNELPPSKPPTPGEDSETIRRSFPAIPTSEILELWTTSRISNPSDTMDVERTLQLKFELVFAFADLQGQLDGDHRDPQWQRVLGSDEFTQAVDEAFVLPAQAAQPGTKKLVQDLKMILATLQARTD